MRRWVQILVVLVLVQAGLVALYQLKTTEPERVSFTPLDRATPELTFETTEGAKRRLSDETGPVIVHFWATWCPPCVGELPGLLEFAERSDVPVLAVSVDPDWESIRSFLNAEPPASVVRAHSSDAAKRLGVDTLPETFVIGRDGRLRARFAGARDWRSDALRQTIAEIVR